MNIQAPEGATDLDPDELEGLKFKHIRTRDELNLLEFNNIKDGILWLKRKKGINFFEESFLRTLHKKLFDQVWEWAGTYRKTGKNIGVEWTKISVEVHNLLDDANFWYKSHTYDPLEIAARFHHRLVFIHPFPNGNGRHARIMSDALLTKVYKIKEIDWAGKSSLDKIGDRRRQYISALQFADKGNLQPLIDFCGGPRN